MVIFISKTTQILEVLYPKSIPTSEFDFVATVILPDIKTLVRKVNTPLPQKVPTQESKYSIQCTSAPLAENIDSSDVKTCSNPIFTEHEKHDHDSTWKESQYKQSKYVKKDGCITIKPVSYRIDTTWEHLCEFFDSLDDRTSLVEGLNKDKTFNLFRFYDAHPNFSCHVDGGVLIKDEVHVPVQTTHNDAGTVDPEHYGE